MVSLAFTINNYSKYHWNWHSWYAWRPVFVYYGVVKTQAAGEYGKCFGRWAWLRVVSRRQVYRREGRLLQHYVYIEPFDLLINEETKDDLRWFKE